MSVINIGRDFSEVPEGRYYTDRADTSGEQFREEFLRPAVDRLRNGEKLTVILDDGVIAYSSAFLKECFGGMVRHGYITGDDLLSRLEIGYSHPDFEFYEERITHYIETAEYDSEPYVRHVAENQPPGP